MCFTYDAIEQACGFLVRAEFNTFVYCCKVCRGEFESGPHLELHILSEHEDDKGSILMPENYVDESISNESPIEIDPAIIKIEPDDENYLVEEEYIEHSYYDLPAIEVVATPKRPVGRPRNTPNQQPLMDSPSETKYGTRNGGVFTEGKYIFSNKLNESDKKDSGKKKMGRPCGAKDKKKRIRRRRHTMVDGDMKKKPVGRPSTSKYDGWNGKAIKAEEQKSQHFGAMDDEFGSNDGLNITGHSDSALQNGFSGNAKRDQSYNDDINGEFGHSSKYIDVGSIDRSCKWNKKHSYRDDDDDTFNVPETKFTGKKKVGRPLGSKDKKKRSYTPRRRRHTMVDGEMKKSPVGRASTSKNDSWNGGTVKAERQSNQHSAAVDDELGGYGGPTQANVNGSVNYNEANGEFGHSSKYVDIGNVDRNCKWNTKRSYREDDTDIFSDLDGNALSQQQSEVPVVKRRPGRPPGAKNKNNRSFASASGSVARGQPSTKQEPIPYTGVYGHYESTSTENQSHRQTVKYDTDFATHSQSSIDYNFSYTDTPSIVGENVPFEVKSEALVAKRRPGRPRKHPLPIDVKTEPLAKRRPGRPPGSKTRRYQHSDTIESVDVHFDEPPKHRLRGRPSAQPNWIDSESESDSRGKRAKNVGKNKSPVNAKANDTQASSAKRVGRPPGAKNKDNINFRPIKIELDDSAPNEASNHLAFEWHDWPTGSSDNQTPSTSMSYFCKPFEIQLEDIYNSDQLQNYLKPTARSDATARPVGRPSGSGKKHH